MKHESFGSSRNDLKQECVLDIILLHKSEVKFRHLPKSAKMLTQLMCLIWLECPLVY